MIAGAKLWILAVLSGSFLGDGYEFLEQGKLNYARTAFRNQIRRHPDDVRARIGLGLTELELGNAQASIEHLLNALSRPEAGFDTRLALARALLLKARSRIATGRFDEATRYLLLDAADQARQAALLRKSAEAWLVRAAALAELMSVDEANEAVRKARELGASPAQALELEAALVYFQAIQKFEFYQENTLPASRQELEQLIATAIKHEQTNPAKLYLRLGDLNHAFGAWDDALAAYRRSLEHEPFNRPCMEVLLTYLAAPEYRETAMDVFRQAAAAGEAKVSRRDPRPAFARYCLAHGHMLEHDYELAVREFEAAQKRDPSLKLECGLGIGEAAFRAGDHQKSKVAYLKAVRTDAEEVLALIKHLRFANLVSASLTFHANEAARAENLADARDLFGLLTRLNPNDTGAWNNFAFLCRETGQYEAARVAYFELLALTPEHPRTLNDTAVVLQYYLKEDLDRAATLYETAIAEAKKLLADPSVADQIKRNAEAAMNDAADNLERLRRQRAKKPGGSR